MARTSTQGTSVPKASVAETAAAMAEVVVPLFARGVVQRRPTAVGLAERIDADARAVGRMRRLRRDHGPGPLVLAVPLRTMALILDPEDVIRVLDGSPEPFALATQEKRGALEHFQPEGVLVSHPPERVERRRFNEEVLEHTSPIHGMAADLLPKVVEEADRLVAACAGRLTWDEYIEAWFRMVRRVVLGDAARDDHAVTDLLADLRAAANWSLVRPKAERTRDRFYRQLNGHLRRAEPGSLAELVAKIPTTETTRPAQQVPQWLFAYDAAAWASYRALALLAAHPDAYEEAGAEVDGQDLGQPHHLSYLRGCVLESLRLWPTTPAVLRQTTERTTWETGELEAGASIVIYAPFFHRDPQHLEYADRFAPQVWMETGTDDLALGPVLHDRWPLIPFSAGPGACPGRNLVLLTATTMLGRLLQERRVRPEREDLLRGGSSMPGTLSPFAPTFRLSTV
jgi:cytochrome P450